MLLAMCFSFVPSCNSRELERVTGGDQTFSSPSKVPHSVEKSSSSFFFFFWIFAPYTLTYVDIATVFSSQATFLSGKLPSSLHMMAHEIYSNKIQALLPFFLRGNISYHPWHSTSFACHRIYCINWRIVAEQKWNPREREGLTIPTKIVHTVVSCTAWSHASQTKPGNSATKIIKNKHALGGKNTIVDLTTEALLSLGLVMRECMWDYICKSWWARFDKKASVRATMVVTCQVPW